MIQRETPYHHSFIGLNNERGGKRNLNYGNAILSRHPSYTPKQVRDVLMSTAHKGGIFLNCLDDACKESPNVMLHLDCNSA